MDLKSRDGRQGCRQEKALKSGSFSKLRFKLRENARLSGLADLNLIQLGLKALERIEQPLFRRC